MDTVKIYRMQRGTCKIIEVIEVPQEQADKYIIENNAQNADLYFRKDEDD